jgi:uncharacterized protein YbjQ (UPF0145 family)
MRLASVTFTIALVGCGSAASTTTRPSSFVVENPGGSNNHILVTTQQTCPPKAEGCDILEVIDLHTSATSEDKGFDELRGRAAARGGDAVIGAEFEHGDNGGPSHLSGMIVRFSTPIPPHVDLGEIDIPSDEDNEDKGLTELAARGRAMGGDQVIGVTFEHGDNGEQGHLKGHAIRFTR